MEGLHNPHRSTGNPGLVPPPRYTQVPPRLCFPMVLTQEMLVPPVKAVAMGLRWQLWGQALVQGQNL